MGEARQRGNFETRKAGAAKRNMRAAAKEFGLALDDSDPMVVSLRQSVDAFLRRITPEEWQVRRAGIIERLNAPTNATGLADVQPVRVQEDEIAWYIFLCDQTLNAPFCVDDSQAQRILPFFVRLGQLWEFASRIPGVNAKLDEMLGPKKNQPDGLLFELIVALSYAAQGWDVEFIPETRRAKTADMKISKGEAEYYVECKRMSRTSEYLKAETTAFLRLWDAGTEILKSNNQWIWAKGAFHVEPAELPESFLADLWRKHLPIGNGEHLLLDDERATIYARRIDQRAVETHFREYRVKANSPKLTSIIGGNWAPENSSVSLLPKIAPTFVRGCESPVLGMYVEDVSFACGFTRSIDADKAIDAKARDIKRLLVSAVDQVPATAPSIIHIAAETLEGQDVERLRTNKLLELVQGFDYGEKPVKLVRFHRFQSHQRADILFELDETVDNLKVGDIDLTTLPRVLMTNEADLVDGIAHWDRFPE